jgi:hypothetical protein
MAHVNLFFAVIIAGARAARRHRRGRKDRERATRRSQLASTPALPCLLRSSPVRRRRAQERRIESNTITTTSRPRPPQVSFLYHFFTPTRAYHSPALSRARGLIVGRCICCSLNDRCTRARIPSNVDGRDRRAGLPKCASRDVRIAPKLLIFPLRTQ